MTRRLLLAVLFAAFCLLTLFIYRAILFPSDQAALPWGSDTLGHVMKVEFLQSQVAQGRLYPNLFPGWYMGVQMMRYYPPLPYYLLLLLSYPAGGAIAAASWLVALCALAGGVSWLLYSRWVGLWPAAVGGVLYLFLPDNLRVALAEGNLPRTLAAALLPLAVYFLLRALEERGQRRHLAALALCFTAILLSHAMMAAIYAACLGALAALLWLLRAASFRRMVWTVSAIALGILLGGWWFLPSLTGGITEIDASAMTEALSVIPLSDYLNPLLRAANPESCYPGAALLILAAAFLFVRTGRSGKTAALTLVGLFGVLISTPGFNTLFNALPMHNLFWPLRFLGIASSLLLLALIWRIQAVFQSPKPWLALLILLPILADQWISTRLVHLRPPHAEVLATARALTNLPGWRQATFDFSRLGSPASYYYTALGQREQIFGWAYQGARTARNVANLNEALSTGYYHYLLDRLALYGVDDLVFLNEEVRPPLPELLAQAGYQPRYQGSTLTLYHRDGAPRAVLADWRVLGIGRGAYNLSFLFPEIIVGAHTQVDRYSLEELTAYQALFLSGFDWDNRVQAEERIKQAAQAGVSVVIDLTGSPDDPLAREPHFLDVWGEPLLLADAPIQVTAAGTAHFLAPVGAEFSAWQSHVPQGMQVETIQFDYLNVKGAVLGYNQYGSGKVWFIGINLPYRVFLNRDPFIIQLFSDLLGVQPNQANPYQTTPLTGYTASEDGYTFTYVLEQPHQLLVPVAAHDGVEVRIDGQAAPHSALENLVRFQAPAGAHQVEIRFRPTLIYRAGQAASVAALIGLIILLVWRPKTAPEVQA